jgi:hypothetical protein
MTMAMPIVRSNESGVSDLFQYVLFRNAGAVSAAIFIRRGWTFYLSSCLRIECQGWWPRLMPRFIGVSISNVHTAIETTAMVFVGEISHIHWMARITPSFITLGITGEIATHASVIAGLLGRVTEIQNTE